MPAPKLLADDGFKAWFIEIVSVFEQVSGQKRTELLMDHRSFYLLI